MLNLLSLWTSGMIAIDFIAFTHIWSTRPGILGVDQGDCKRPLYSSFFSRSVYLHESDQAYNDILFLCEKYAPFDHPDKYDPDKDISVTGAYTKFEMSQLH